jgi:hypothetical protein
MVIEEMSDEDLVSSHKTAVMDFVARGSNNLDEIRDLEAELLRRLKGGEIDVRDKSGRH